MRKIFLLFVFALLAAWRVPAEEKPPEAFLKTVRSPANRGSWGKMEGSVIHRRRGFPSVKAPIRFAVLFTPARTVAQIFFNGKELYNAGQSANPPYDASLEMKDVPEKPLLAEFGIRPEDLTMSFIFWKFKKEAPETTVRTIPCRVMDLENEKGTESVRVSFSKGYYFPLRVQWFRGPASSISGKAFRTLEITSFSKTNGLWVTTELAVSGPGWMSVISFPAIDAGLVNGGTGIPQDLFK